MAALKSPAVLRPREVRPACRPPKAHGSRQRPWRPSSQRTGREKAWLLFQRMDRWKLRSLASDPSSADSTCSALTPTRSHPCKSGQADRTAQPNPLPHSQANKSCNGSFQAGEAAAKQAAGVAAHSSSAQALLLLDSPHIVHTLCICLDEDVCLRHPVLLAEARQGL